MNTIADVTQLDKVMINIKKIQDITLPYPFHTSVSLPVEMHLSVSC